MNDHQPRRWFQLSLKSLFLLTLVVAAFFGGYALATRRAEETIQAEQEARARAEETARDAEAARQTERRLRVKAEFDSGVDDRGLLRIRAR